MRKYARLDSNHNAIVSALRQACCSVQSLASIGNGCPDLLIARNGKLFLLEIKDGKKCPSERRLTEDEKTWIERWKAPVHVVSSVGEALAIISQVS